MNGLPPSRTSRKRSRKSAQSSTASFVVTSSAAIPKLRGRSTGEPLTPRCEGVDWE